MKLGEVCNLESEYDAARRRLARKQEIKRPCWGVGDGVLPGHVVLWLVIDDQRPACREGDGHRAGNAMDVGWCAATLQWRGYYRPLSHIITQLHLCTCTWHPAPCPLPPCPPAPCTLQPRVPRPSLSRSFHSLLPPCTPGGRGEGSKERKKKAYHGVLSYAQLARLLHPGRRTRNAYQAIR